MRGDRGVDETRALVGPRHVTGYKNHGVALGAEGGGDLFSTVTATPHADHQSALPGETAGGRSTNPRGYSRYRDHFSVKGHFSNAPASMGRVTPVTNREASEASRRTASDMSDASTWVTGIACIA